MMLKAWQNDSGGGHGSDYEKEGDDKMIEAIRRCHAPTPAWAKRGGATRDWDSLTCFLDLSGPISVI